MKNRNDTRYDEKNGTTAPGAQRATVPPKRVAAYRYLIVGGTTKAATTSLYTYLADHPAICAATYKETRFFLSADYPLPSKYRYAGDAEGYHLLFPQTDESRIRMESTPDYLYCAAACERIASELPAAQLVFSLRDPISRLVSWYRFARQIGKLPQTLDFDSYVEMLFTEKKSGEQHLQTLKQGCYTIYLTPYFQKLGAARIHVLFYEDLAAQPAQTLAHLCGFAGIESDFYNGYDFKVTNRSQQMRNADLHRRYRALRFRLRQWTHNKPIVHLPLRAVRRTLEPLYLRLNGRQGEEVQMSDAVRHRLMAYYTPDVQALGELIGKPIPWKTFGTST